jgi:hypothetical protein
VSFLLGLFLLTTPTIADYSPKREIIGKVKKQLCNCPNQLISHEVDFELFHEPYLKDSLLLFADREFDNLNKFMSLARVKIIFRIKF